MYNEPRTRLRNPFAIFFCNNFIYDFYLSCASLSFLFSFTLDQHNCRLFWISPVVLVGLPRRVSHHRQDDQYRWRCEHCALLFAYSGCWHLGRSEERRGKWFGGGGHVGRTIHWTFRGNIHNDRWVHANFIIISFQMASPTRCDFVFHIGWRTKVIGIEAKPLNRRTYYFFGSFDCVTSVCILTRGRTCAKNARKNTVSKPFQSIVLAEYFAMNKW